jgi:hypothetical protein
MKQLIILVVVMILATTVVYSADFSNNINVPTYNSYLLLSNSTDELSDAQNYFINTVPDPMVTEKKSSVDDDVNKKAMQAENTSGSNIEGSDDLLFDGSAGAMGVGIF